jgi:hypothetical protein
VYDQNTGERTLVSSGGARGVQGTDDLGFAVGSEERFFFVWARNAAKLATRELALLLSMIGNLGLSLLMVYVVRFQAQKEPLVFVRDALGNVVQADTRSFIYAGRDRTEAEVKAFVKDWVVSAFTWTPLDVKERQEAALSRVDGKAKGKAKAGMRLAERHDQVEQGISGGIYRDGGREPQAVVMSNHPFTIRVSFQRYIVDRAGVITDAGPLFVFAVLAEVPRSSENGYGLLVTDVEVSREL